MLCIAICRHVYNCTVAAHFLYQFLKLLAFDFLCAICRFFLSLLLSVIISAIRAVDAVFKSVDLSGVPRFSMNDAVVIRVCSRSY